MTPPSFAPAIALPPFDVQKRLAELQKMLDENTVPQEQRANITLAIEMYRKGELPRKLGELTLFQDGKVTTLEEIHGKSPWWAEGVGYQLMQTTGDPSQSSGQSGEALTAQQFAQRATYNYVNTYSGHEILARMRLIPDLGGTDATVNVSILNDTGSTVQSVLQTDLAAMGLNPQYGGLGPAIVVQTANGPVNRQSIFVELQLMRADGTAVSGWIRELGLITPPGAAQMRLTGAGIRNHLYFATAPGNQNLYVAEKKNGIMSELPAL